MKARAILLGVGLANAAWTLALVVAPLSLAPGTVAGLSGHANVIDHAHLWAELPPFARLVYTVGDLNCHQLASRSWELGGNQIPVDVRMFAAFLFANLGFAWAGRGPAFSGYRDAATQLWPQRWQQRLDSPRRRLVAVQALWAVAFLPAFVDVTMQLASDYESTNPLRLLTGGLLGILGGALLGAFLRAMALPGIPVSAAAPQKNTDD